MNGNLPNNHHVLLCKTRLKIQTIYGKGNIINVNLYMVDKKRNRITGSN